MYKKSDDEKRRERISLLVMVALFSWLQRRRVGPGFRRAVQGWRTNWVRMLAQLITSAIIGQCIFWLVGYDQLGEGGVAPRVQFGYLKKVAVRLADRFPDDPMWAWLLKALEIATDFGKMPIEGAVYLRHGIVSDAWAATVTQPWWSGVEGLDKLNGAIHYPAQVTNREQIAISLGCTLGSLFRYVLAALVWFGGSTVNRRLTDPIEHGLRRALYHN